MGMIGGLLGGVQGVFDFLRSFFSCLPMAFQLLTYASFGGTLLIALFKVIKG